VVTAFDVEIIRSVAPVAPATDGAVHPSVTYAVPSEVKATDEMAENLAEPEAPAVPSAHTPVDCPMVVTAPAGSTVRSLLLSTT
jgi:hypothetical protein